MAPNILLSCEAISKSYGVRALFSDLSLALSDGDHVGLIGPNGSGKSTLLKILMGLRVPDEGTRTLRRHTRIGYVPQEPVFPPDNSIEQVLQDTLTEDGHDPHEQGGRIARALSIGNFPDAQQAVSRLSGGWRKRFGHHPGLAPRTGCAARGRADNHLDLEGILWLEQLLKNRSKAFLVISHDRRFLESVASRMVELNRCYPDGGLKPAATTAISSNNAMPPSKRRPTIRPRWPIASVVKSNGYAEGRKPERPKPRAAFSRQESSLTN